MAIRTTTIAVAHVVKKKAEMLLCLSLQAKSSSLRNIFKVKLFYATNLFSHEINLKSE